MRKILILANNAGGLYNFRFELIEKLIEENYEVYFSLPESADNEKVKLIIKAGAKHIQTYINRRGINPVEDFKLINEYKRIIRDVNPDVVLTYTIKPNIYGSYAAKRLNKKVIMNITGIGTALMYSKLKPVIRKLYKIAAGHSIKVFFQNTANRELFLENNMVKQDKTILLPGSGVNLNKFTPMPKEDANDPIIFLFIGRVMKEKGIDEYLEAAESLTERYSNIEFQIVGSFEEAEYKERILNNENKRITFLGRSNDVRNEIKEVDCIVNPSYHEGMSNVLLEGAAMGKPLIASNIPGCKEIVEDGHNGYLFEVKSTASLRNKLIQFVELRNEERKVMGRNSRNKVEAEFDRNIVINKYIGLLADLLNSEEDVK